MEQDDNRSSDAELAAVLAHASRPGLPEGAAERLMARIATEPQETKVLRLAPRPRTGVPDPWRYAAALPLAASLALGVWLGANGKMDFMMPNAITGGVVLNDDTPVDDLGGMGDAYAEESTS